MALGTDLDFYGSFGLWGKHWVSLSVRDYQHPEKYIGEKKDWDLCEKILKEVSDEMRLKAERKEGEAALYGPKLDFMFKDALGKELQIPTVQIDFATPKRFNLTYIDKKGKEKNPVMVHRAILGSYERFLALMLEYYAGALPFWLAPEQIWIIPIGSRHEKYAKEIGEKLKTSGLRFQIKDENENAHVRTPAVIGGNGFLFVYEATGYRQEIFASKFWHYAVFLPLVIANR